MSISESDLVAVDEFFADRAKRLDGPHPLWSDSSRKDEFQAIWPIIESSGLERAHLRFRVGYESREWPSINVIFRDESVTRLDRVNDSICEPNPPSARILGLPAIVCGTHIHSWSNNRTHIANSKSWEMPIRAPVAAKMRTLTHMFHWFADDIGLILTSEQRGFDIPRKGLFESLA